jgi:hypothetical protein
MKRSEYLANKDVAEFINYFKAVSCYESSVFIQKYTPKKDRNRPFAITRFKDALVNYYWMKDDFDSTCRKTALLSRQIDEAVRNCNETDVLKAALRIYDWGGVMNEASVRWLLDLHDSGRLIDSLQSGVTLLTGDNEESFDRFIDNKELRSDSATTKVFSFASKGNSIIYDDRVGGAIALIVREFLKKRGDKNVPPLLNFMRGSKTRNPSEKPYQFIGKKAGRDHAISNLRANWIIAEIASDWRSPINLAASNAMREIESCLFMIGYDVSTVSRISES